jgi:predicted secreted hydrolase
MKRWILVVLVLVSIAGATFWWQSVTEPGSATTADASLIPLLTEENSSGFAQAREPGAIRFPRDLGSHNEYQTEWWYYTGNLKTAEGRPFGYQLTFFRRALTPPTSESAASGPASDSRWRTNQIYLAHFTISDIANDAFYPSERFSRGAAGLAGAQASPYHVWLEDWHVEEVEPGTVRLYASTEQVRLNVTLKQTLPPVLHGNEGLSPKGDEPGNASYYYSIVRQETAGTIQVEDQTYDVTGLSWKDHEYSTSALSQGAVGWDWFSLQLDNGTALMFFQIRRQDGSLEPASSGSFITADGTVRPIDRGEWQLTVSDTWTSPASGAEYPAAWTIRIPALDLALTGEPLMPNQELNVSTTYWEGAVTFEGTIAGQPVTARGYIEMTGYAETMEGRL